MSWAQARKARPASFSRTPRPLAVEQRRADLCFQLADLLRQRRLRHAQLLGGLREVLGFGGGNEIAQMPQFHIDTF